MRAKSSFVDPEGQVMHWHEFGDLEGPGWAANAIGGAHLQPDGFIWPYFDLAKERFCLNYAHNDDWLCPGSLARIGVQMREFAENLGDTENGVRLRRTTENLAGWLESHVPMLPSGWVPRRITRDGRAYSLDPLGSPDPLFERSADGLFLLQLWALTGRHDLARSLGDAFVSAGGLWGSINHDTFDEHENVAYAVAFRALRQACVPLGRPEWRSFSFLSALPAMLRFRLAEDRNGVATRGLFLMEESWDTAYLWENAEVAQAFLEAWQESGDVSGLEIALGVLEAAALHHYGSQGFLTEGVDWNNHVGQQHHIGNALYGAIRYTEPLLNNLHILLPTLTYFQVTGYRP